ncbi:hypothetical protein, partial [Comamonas sp.]|uniref:hypothetical protein n=1 Tax=Comamonas sp. TaxID=34028 RepID=UPI0028992721
FLAAQEKYLARRGETRPAAASQANKQADKSKTRKNKQHGFPTNPKIPTFQRAEAATKATPAPPQA